MKFDDIEKKVNTANNLDELFGLWKEAHSVEKDWEETTILEEDLPKRDEKDKKQKEPWKNRDRLRNHFVEDGFVYEDAYRNAKRKVLFVLKEANIADNKEESHYLADDFHDKWYRDFAEGRYDINSGKIKAKNEKDKEYSVDNPGNQIQLIGRMNYILQGELPFLARINPTVKDIQESVKSVAFMNLNKRGGAGETNAEKFIRYCEKYRIFVQREIQIINPDVIVWCAREVNPEKILGTKYDKKVLKMTHPAGKIYIENEDKDLINSLKNVDLIKKYSHCNLEQLHIEMQKSDHEKYFRLNRPTLKYMLVFSERAKDYFNKE